MNATEQYAKTFLDREIRAVEGSPRNAECPELTLYEKALIFKYSEDGYESLNEILRDSKGEKMNDFAKLLLIALDKLPDYRGLVYRNVKLTMAQQKRYEKALKGNQLLKEYAFVSTTKSKLIANQYGGNTSFRIISRTGKDIEKIAKFGIHNSTPNEKEVLFRPNQNFRILDFLNEDEQVIITMEEV